MSKFYCNECNKDFEMSYWKWLFTTLFHTFTKRLTKCPHCGKKSWMRRQK